MHGEPPFSLKSLVKCCLLHPMYILTFQLSSTYLNNMHRVRGFLIKKY